MRKIAEAENEMWSSIEEEYYAWKTTIIQLARDARKYYEECGHRISNYLRHLPEVTTDGSSAASSRLDAQLAEFLRGISLKRFDKEYQARLDFIKELYELLLKEFPEAEIHPFGSFLTGLSDKNSDIDIYVNLHKNGNGRVRRNGFKERGEVPKWEQELQQVYEVGQILKESGLYTNIEQITKTVVPIIKFEHQKFGLNCDLSFKSLLSTQNSKLIRLYTQVDLRIGPLMRIVRYWAKFHGFCGSMQIKTYTLNLMVLFYFMNQKFVPTVHQLQTQNVSDLNALGIATLDDTGYSLVPLGGIEHKIAGWNGGFLDDPNLVRQFMQKFKRGGFKPWKRTDSSLATPSAGPLPAVEILILLQDFMEFFADFDYVNTMISTLTGEVRRKYEFDRFNMRYLPQAFNLYKDRFRNCSDPGKVELAIRPTVLCVQDPFILNFNVGQRAKAVDIENWQYCCTITAEAIKNLLERMTAGEEGFKFQDIFFSIDFDEVMGTDAERQDNRDRKLCLARSRFTQMLLEEEAAKLKAGMISEKDDEDEESEDENADDIVGDGDGNDVGPD